MKVFNKYDTIMGPNSGIDIKDYIKNITTYKHYVTASSDDVSNKFLSNDKLSLKRIIRMVSLFTPVRTCWGLMQVTDSSFMTNLIEMHTIETKLGSKDMVSLSIVWYLAIKRKYMTAVVVDHHELSGANVLATILGSTVRKRFSKPVHAFPLDMAVANRF